MVQRSFTRIGGGKEKASSRGKRDFELNLEGSAFLEFLEARKVGSIHRHEFFGFTGGWVHLKVQC